MAPRLLIVGADEHRIVRGAGFVEFAGQHERRSVLVVEIFLREKTWLQLERLSIVVDRRVVAGEVLERRRKIDVIGRAGRIALDLHPVCGDRLPGTPETHVVVADTSPGAAITGVDGELGAPELDRAFTIPAPTFGGGAHLEALPIAEPVEKAQGLVEVLVPVRPVIRPIVR